MNPRSQRDAALIASDLLARALPGARSGRRQHGALAERIAADIWRRWQVGPWQWQAKHLRWWLTAQGVVLGDATRYRYFLTITKLLHALGREHWLPQLQGPWTRPDGQARVSRGAGGRPMKLPRPLP